MIRRLSFFLAVLLAGGLTASVSQAADVTVRAINGKTGEPLAGYQVWLDGSKRSADLFAKVRGSSPTRVAHILVFIYAPERASKGLARTGGSTLDAPDLSFR